MLCAATIALWLELQPASGVLGLHPVDMLLVPVWTTSAQQLHRGTTANVTS
jgi:hypothetical protein